MECLTLQPGPDGSPVPVEANLLRLANQPDLTKLSPEALRRVEAGQALPDFFLLSSEDKAHSPPRLSVWVVGLTTVPQAWVLVGANPKRTWALELKVADVVRLPITSSDQATESVRLEVHWERAYRVMPDQSRVPELREGWAGHAGIANLEQGNKSQRAIIRLALADLAHVRLMTDSELLAAAALAKQPEVLLNEPSP